MFDLCGSLMYITIMKKIFIDGSAGTTGLRIRERLAARNEFEYIVLSESDRKLPSARKSAIAESDFTFLCLPDAAAIEAVELAEGSSARIIDASTAHRTKEGWAYGFPELSTDFRKKIETSSRVAVPGCHAGGFQAIVYPLIKSGVLEKNSALTCFSLTGYSGGGKSMISDYQNEGNRNPELDSPRIYGLTQQHKHLKEMQAISGLTYAPIFCPIVADYYSGMAVTVPLFAKDLNNGATVQDVFSALADNYSTAKLVKVLPYADAELNGFLPANRLTGKDRMELYVGGNAERITVTAIFDNLGKGASGAAIQCLNVMNGEEETKGLVL